MIFSQKISIVYRLASHPLVRMHPKKDQLNQRKRAKMINQQTNFYRSEPRHSCRITTSVSKSANFKRGRAFERFRDISAPSKLGPNPNIVHLFQEAGLFRFSCT